MTSSISTKELSQQLPNPELVVVDVRSTAAYNGWRLQREARGGHVRGAVSFPLSWADVVTAADLISLLASKGITPNRSVVVYGYGQDESAAIAKILRGLGYTNVLTHDAGLAEWAADDSLPMARLANEVFDFVSDPANDALYRSGVRFADLGQCSSIVPRQTLHETIWKRSVCRIRKMSFMVAEATETVSMAPLEMSEPHPFLESP